MIQTHSTKAAAAALHTRTYLVGVADLLELLVRGGVVGVPVRMVVTRLYKEINVVIIMAHHGTLQYGTLQYSTALDYHSTME